MNSLDQHLQALGLVRRLRLVELERARMGLATALGAHARAQEAERARGDQMGRDARLAAESFGRAPDVRTHAAWIRHLVRLEDGLAAARSTASVAASDVEVRRGSAIGSDARLQAADQASARLREELRRVRHRRQSVEADTQWLLRPQVEDGSC